MQMQSEASEPKKSKFGVFREIPKDASGEKTSRKKHQRHLGVLVNCCFGWVGVCFFLGGVVGLFWGDSFFLKVLFAF